MVLPLLLALAASPDLIPARWNSTDPASLDLVRNTPINCLLIDWNSNRAPEIGRFAAAAGQSGIHALAVLKPTADLIESVRRASAANIEGIVLEGDFPPDAAAKVRDAVKTLVVEITPRSQMKLGSSGIIGTYQAVWPGIQITEDGAAHAGPTGGPWIDTNSGFLRSVRAWGDATIWIANQPPPKTVVTTERYVQVISDAAMVGARWVIALDADTESALAERKPKALATWQKIVDHLKFLESHKEWRSLRPTGQLAVVQDIDAGALLSGGIVDMISVKHTPVRPVPRSKLGPSVFEGVTMAVNTDPEGLTDDQKQALRSFTRGGGTLLTAPPGWKSGAAAKTDKITLEKAEIERLDAIWKEVNSMIGRRNLGARLFNVSTMLSNLLASPDGKEIVVHLVNYSEYPVEWVTAQFLGKYKRVRLFTPETGETEIKPYDTEEGTGVDIPKVHVWATLRLD
jgi:hypothetical protein